MKTTKIVYDVLYVGTEMGVKISDLMASCDLGIEAVGIRENFILTVDRKPTKKYIKQLQEIIIEAVKKTGGKVYNIEYKETIIINK